MRKKYLRSFLFSGLVILGVTFAQSQEKDQVIKQKVEGSNGRPSMIIFNESANYSPGQSKQIFKQHLKLSQQDDYKKIKSENDRVGYVHEKYQQYYKNIKVEFGTYTVHSKKGKVESISGEFYEPGTVNLNPRLTKAQGLQAAMSHIGAQSYLWEDQAASKELGYKKPDGELVLLPAFDNLDKKESQDRLRLAYKYEIFTIKPLGGADVYVDANTGEILFYNARVKHADNFGYDGRNNASVTIAERENTIKTLATAMVSGVADTRYSGNQTIETTLSGGNYTLNDASRKVYTRNANNMAPGTTTLPYITNYTEFTDNDNNWTAAEYDNADKDNAALDAHWGAMMTYDYWMNVHGRNSYDNAGSQLRSYVHVDNNYDNAFWYLNVMSYGDGSSNGTEGNGYFDALTSLDVAGHEIGHGVCEYTANLAYQKESGAMNEAFSDIWGAAIEHYAKGNGSDTNPDASIWLIGDEIDRRTGSVALRSMSNPSSLGQPDTYGGTYWVSVSCTPTSSNDYCGVHTNSGVLNFWFYLLTVGGSGTNDIGSSYSVSGIGMSKASQIAFRMESVYLSANSTYANARTYGIQAAKDLYGAGSSAEIAVTNAWHAVGVGSAYGDTSANYCASASSNVNDEYIGRVQLNTIDNASGGQFYSNYTSISTDLSKDTQYTITITPTWTGTVYSEGYAVWIDYNQNGDFTDSGELVYSRSASTTTPINGSFTVPASASDGSTRMRVSMKYNGIPTSCESFTYGEVEDYTVNIGGSSGGDTEAPTAPANLTASNITETTATLTWTASTDNVGVTGYDVYQGTTNIGTVTGTSANITSLVANTQYSFSVKAKDAAGNVSAASNTVTFTTPSGADTQAPTAPTNLTASNVTQSTVDLSWTASTDNVGVSGYDIYQNGIKVSTVTATSTTISGLTAATSYSFYAVAKDAAGNTSTASNTINVTTQSSGTGSSLVLFDGSFETGWEGWIDGGSDVARYASSTYAYDGNYSIQLRDNSGTASAMTSPSYNIAGYDNVEIVFFFYAYSMETGEDFWVRYYDGSSWSTVAAYASGTSFNNNAFYTATVNIPASSYNFPTNAKFSFQCDASSNSDYIFIDKVTITASSAGAAFGNTVAEIGGISGFVAGTQNNLSSEIDGLDVSPNPASNEVTVAAELDLDNVTSEDVQISIYTVYGRLVQQKNWNKVTAMYFEKKIDVSALPKGIYYITFTSSSGYKETQKLIVR